MPFIKYKPFTLDSRPCYKCGREITQGDYNWTYHTRTAGMFSHRQCSMSELEFQRYNERFGTLDRSTISEETKPEPVTQEPTQEPTQSYADITDLINPDSKHYLTEWIKTVLTMREYPFLFGAPGAGKTHLVRSIADDMGLDFCLISCANDMFKSELLGSVSPLNGNYFASTFFKFWEKGGVILLDECCLGSGAFLNVLNSALEQKEIRFPNGQRVSMHSHCFIIFADNSAGYGGDAMFPERQDIGQAFRDRVSYIPFDYDEKLEARVTLSIFKNDTTRAANWISVVRKLRKTIPSDIPVFASPRFMYKGAKAFMRGLTFDQVVTMYLLRGLNGDIKKQCEVAINAVRGNY